MAKLHIQDPKVLRSLGHALDEFAQNASKILQGVDQEAQRFLNVVYKRVRHWEQMVKKAYRMVQQAQMALRRCEASGYTDSDGNYYPPDCSYELRALEEAKRFVHECEQNLAKSKEWHNRLQLGMRSYGSESRRFQHFLQQNNKDAGKYLNQAAKNYEQVHQASESYVNNIRSSAVRQAWKLEQKLVQATGKGSQEWNGNQLAKLRRGENITGYEGHHIRDVSSHRIRWAGDPRNIIFLKDRKTHLDAHRGRTTNPTTGKLIDRELILKNRISRR